MTTKAGKMASRDPTPEWWKQSMVYQVYPRSFSDTTSTGVGDLQGIISKLDYLSLLCDIVWLSPIHPSGGADFGYDISCYTEIDPLFGTMMDFEKLVSAAASKNMKIMLDGVFNHTSDEHDWFMESRRSIDSPKRDWYIWAKPDENGGPPNNWYSNFGMPAWTLDEETSEYYMHSFDPKQPDLNWRNPEVVEAVLHAMEFWLKKGVKGFRLDVFNSYFKEAQLIDNPPRRDMLGQLGRLFFPYISQYHVNDKDQYSEMKVILQRMRSLCDTYDACLVGETLDENFEYENAPRYVNDSQLHMTFNFKLLYSKFGSVQFAQAIRKWVSSVEDKASVTWVVDNHDVYRSATRWRGWTKAQTLKRNKIVGILLFTLRGVPFLYQGQEIGMTEMSMKRKDIVDPPGKRYWPFYQGRDGCRTPMQWDGDEANAGFSKSNKTWLPVNSNSSEVNVKQQTTDEGSLLSLYTDMIKLRREHRVFQAESEMSFPEKDDSTILTFTRNLGQEHGVRVLMNMSSWRSASISHVLEPAERDVVVKEGNILYSTAPKSDLSFGAPLGQIKIPPLEAIIVAIK